MTLRRAMRAKARHLAGGDPHGCRRPDATTAADVVVVLTAAPHDTIEQVCMHRSHPMLLSPRWLVWWPGLPSSSSALGKAWLPAQNGRGRGEPPRHRSSHTAAPRRACACAGSGGQHSPSICRHLQATPTAAGEPPYSAVFLCILWNESTHYWTLYLQRCFLGSLSRRGYIKVVSCSNYKWWQES